MKHIKFLSHRNHAIWYGDGVYMVAKGDGTDEYFTDWKDAMKWIDQIEDTREGSK